MAHENDFAILFAEFLEGIEEAGFEFFADIGRGGREVLVGELAFEVHAGPVHVAAGFDRLFLVDGSSLGVMAAVHVDHAVFGKLPEPKMERHFSFVDVTGKASVGFDEDVLDDVAGVDSAGDLAVEPEGDHFSKRLAVAVHEIINGCFVSCAGIREESDCFVAVGPEGHR